MDGILRAGFIADTHDEQYGLMRRAVGHMMDKGGVDYLFHLGDFLYNFGSIAERNSYRPYRTLAQRLGLIQKEFGLKEIYVIPGNHEVAHPEKGLCELEEFSIHEKVIDVEGYKFLGYGGGYDFAKLNGWDRYDDKRYKCDFGKFETLLRDSHVDIVLLHQLEKKVFGGDSLRQAIDDLKPKIVISGHTHKHGFEFYERPLYTSCGPIFPLDGKRPRIMGKSSFGILDIKNRFAKMELYFFKKDGNRDRVELDGEASINFRNH
jgi:predicted phosphodiesterase